MTGQGLCFKALDGFFSNYLLTHIPIVCSGHTPIVLYAHSGSQIKGRPNRIEAWCLRYQELIHSLKMIWDNSLQGSYMFQVINKLKDCKLACKKCCSDKRSERRKIWNTNITEVLAIQETFNASQLGMSGVLNLNHVQQDQSTRKAINGMIPSCSWTRL